MARMRRILEGVTAAGEPLLTGEVGWRGMLGTDLPPVLLRQVASQGMEDAMGGRARPEGPWAAVLSLRREGHECIPQRLGLLGHRHQLAFTVLRFVGVEALLDVGATVLQQAIDQASQFVCRRRDGLWGTEADFHPPKEGPQGALRVVQTAGGEAQGDRDTMCPGAHSPRQHLGKAKVPGTVSPQGHG